MPNRFSFYSFQKFLNGRSIPGLRLFYPFICQYRVLWSREKNVSLKTVQYGTLKSVIYPENATFFYVSAVLFHTSNAACSLLHGYKNNPAHFPLYEMLLKYLPFFIQFVSRLMTLQFVYIKCLGWVRKLVFTVCNLLHLLYYCAFPRFPSTWKRGTVVISSSHTMSDSSQKNTLT